MKHLAFVLAYVIILLATAGYGGWCILQSTLSIDLKRTLTATADPSSSEVDVHVCIRDARLLVRAAEDRLVLNKLVAVLDIKDNVRHATDPDKARVTAKRLYLVFLSDFGLHPPK
jgi:hypothetical protein